MMICIMLQTILFRKVSMDLHRKIKVESATKIIFMYKLYNLAMKKFSTKMKENNFPVNYTYGPTDEYKDARVEKVDSKIYKNFRITCIQKDISISQGINLALTNWLEEYKDDISDVG